MERKVSYFETTGINIQSLKVKESRDLLRHYIYEQISSIQNKCKICAK